MAPLRLPMKITTVCIGEACAGVWSRDAAKGGRAGVQEDQLALETLAVFLILWLIFTLVAVLREMSLRRYLYAQLSGLAPAPSPEKAPLMRNIIKQFERLNEEFPVQMGNVEQVESCTVCLENIDEHSPFRKLQCSHTFHISCIDRWVLQSLGSQNPPASPSCPVCKTPVLIADSAPESGATVASPMEHDEEITNISDDIEALLA